MSVEVERIARTLAGNNLAPERQFFALRAAKALLDLRRIQTARVRILNKYLQSEYGVGDIRGAIFELVKLERYEDRAMTRRDKALQFL
jgi:hypothetical protein